jgi:bifunctional DNA-binding transcriptional regulator/antitoxin component of YhaV-PrlF toxin-antitoxin module
MPVQAIKLTSKRQATFPAAVCRDMGLHPGDRIALERREIGGSPAWVMRPVSGEKSTPWFGVLRAYAADKSHDMEDIRQSIGRGIAEAKS